MHQADVRFDDAVDVQMSLPTASSEWTRTALLRAQLDQPPVQPLFLYDGPSVCCLRRESAAETILGRPQRRRGERERESLTVGPAWAKGVDPSRNSSPYGERERERERAGSTVGPAWAKGVCW